jgi:hypothetical protein
LTVNSRRESGGTHTVLRHDGQKGLNNVQMERTENAIDQQPIIRRRPCISNGAAEHAFIWRRSARHP